MKWFVLAACVLSLAACQTQRVQVGPFEGQVSSVSIGTPGAQEILDELLGEPDPPLMQHEAQNSLRADKTAITNRR